MNTQHDTIPRTLNSMLREITITLAITIAAFAAPSIHATEIDPTKIEKVKVRVITEVDRFTGTKMIFARNPLPMAGTGFFTTLTFNPAAAIAENDEAPSFYAAIQYTGEGWMNMSGTIDLLIDGARTNLPGLIRPSDKQVGSCLGSTCSVHETIRVPLTESIVELISQARSVEIRVRGDQYNATGRLTEKHIAHLRAVWDEYQKAIAEN